jgi:hypothetical protein
VTCFESRRPKKATTNVAIRATPKTTMEMFTKPSITGKAASTEPFGKMLRNPGPAASIFRQNTCGVRDATTTTAVIAIAVPPRRTTACSVSAYTEPLNPPTAGLRLFAALAVGIAMVLTGLMAREIGGRRPAQLVAAWAAATAGPVVSFGYLFQYVSFDYLWWVLTAWMPATSGLAAQTGSCPRSSGR